MLGLTKKAIGHVLQICRDMDGEVALWIVILFVALAAAAICLLALFLKARKLGEAVKRLRRRGQDLERMNASVAAFSHRSADIVSQITEGKIPELKAQEVFFKDLLKEAKESFNCASCAFFGYDKDRGVIRLEVMDGLFPSCLDIDSETLKYVAGHEDKVAEYLLNHDFNLKDTPFAPVVELGLPKNYSKEDCEEKFRNRVYGLWGMLVVPVRFQGRIRGVLAMSNKAGEEAFDKGDRELANGMAEVASLTLDQLELTKAVKEKTAMDSQLETAASIQAHLLGKTSCLKGNIEVMASYRTAYRLGGDYYDFIEVDERHLGVLVADVSGKGIPAGLVMASTRALMTVLSPDVLSPAELLTKLDAYLFRLIPETMFVTAVYSVIDVQTGEMVCASAGHEPFLIAHEGDAVSPCSGQGMVLGILDGDVFGEGIEDRTYQLDPGDMALFYTDGAVEALNRRHEEFSLDRLKSALEAVRHKTPAEALEFLKERIEKFVDGEQAYDDITLVSLRFRSALEFVVEK